MYSDSAPIVAIATATGRGAVGIVRLSGSNLRNIAQQLTGRELQPRMATLTPFYDSSNRVLDRGIAIYFPAPHSYTGEDVLELQAHGGPAVLHLLADACLHRGSSMGMRHAHAGEFTQRAFLNSKMDLAQAEAVADLIEAHTASAARAAAQSLTGAFSQHTDTLQEQLTHARMWVEANLDFPEEELDSLETEAIIRQLLDVSAQVSNTLQQARQGVLLRDGIRVALAGQPNVGKSSLLNALAGAELAIVTDIAGTTRDTREQYIQIDGVPLHIIDTAGLRDSEDTVEKIGMERAWDAIRQADIIIHLKDAYRHTPPAPSLPETEYAEHLIHAERDRQLAEQLRTLPAERSNTPVLSVWNKTDRLQGTPDEQHKTLEDAGFCAATDIAISVREGSGLNTLRQRILQLAGWQQDSTPTFSARERHIRALQTAGQHIDSGLHQLQASDRQHSGCQLDLAAEELRLAQQALSEITGQFTADDLLGTIFAKFCIGK